MHPSLLASHLYGPWHVVNVQEGAGFVTDSSLAENFHVTTQPIALFSSTRTRELVHGDPDPVLAQVLFVGHQGQGCYWQVPQSA